MDTAVVERKFNHIGARVKFSDLRDGMRWTTSRPFSINIGRDSEGPFFDIQARKEVEMLVLDAQKQDRHLLLMVKDQKNPKSKFLCGHDERHWFTCAIPENGRASTVLEAKEALKPDALRQIEAQEGLKASRAHKRHRKLDSGRKILRQGEFMFVPEPGFQPPGGSLVSIHRHEPMSRGRSSNPHMAEYLYRTGGETVYVSTYRGAGNGVTQEEYERIRQENPEGFRHHRWESRVRNPKVFVKGRITHRDHATLDLGDLWHRVMLNTEDLASGGQFVAFLD
jgi:hypothetical protein